MTNTILILNCCKLGQNEVELWNGFYAAYKDEFQIIFFTTHTNERIDFPHVMPVQYDTVMFNKKEIGLLCEEIPEEKIQDIAKYDKIWDIYDPVESKKKAYSWYTLWNIAVKFYQPSAVYIWNGYQIASVTLGIIADSLNIEKYFMERGPFAKTFAFDKKGINYNSSFVANYNDMDVTPKEDIVSKFKKIYFSGEVSNWEQPDSIKDKQHFMEKYSIPKNKLLIFFPSQVDQDTSSRVFSPHFTSVYDAYKKTVCVLQKHSDKLFLLTKKHPYQKGDLKKFNELSSSVGVLVEDVHIFDCLTFTDAIISINSSAAVEASLLGKPTLLLGNSILSPSSKVLTLSHPDEIDKKIDALILLVAKKVENNVDNLYLSRLLSGYLYSATPSYNELGIKSILQIPTPKKCNKQNIKNDFQMGDLKTINFFLRKILVDSAELYNKILVDSAELYNKKMFIEILLNSKSWKLTAPLRWIVKKIFKRSDF